MVAGYPSRGAEDRRQVGIVRGLVREKEPLEREKVWTWRIRVLERDGGRKTAKAGKPGRTQASISKPQG